MKLGELDSRQLRRALSKGTLRIQCGPFVHRIYSKVHSLVEDIRFHYADYPLADPGGFADFHLRLMPGRGLRRWIHPQVVFSYDGYHTYDPEPAKNAFPIMEWGFNWCVNTCAHQYLVFHAAAVERDGRVLLIVGRSGAGKSTLCAGLTLAGWRLLSDELALVRPSDGHLIPNPRPVSLKNESIDVIRAFDSTAPIGKPCPDTAKGTLGYMRAPRESVLRDAETAPPAWVVFVTHEPGAPPSLRKQHKGSSLIRLADNGINYSMLGSLGFQTASQLIDQCDCYNFRYGSLDDAAECLGQLPLPSCSTPVGVLDESS